MVAHTGCGKRTIICRVNPFKILVFIATFALSVPNKNPSGKITAARTLNFSLAIMTFINKSAVFELISSIGKLLFMLSLVCIYRSSSLRADVKNPPVPQAKSATLSPILGLIILAIKSVTARGV